MPTIACPSCGKQYKLPATAAGQVAKCACGKRFKLRTAPKDTAPITHEPHAAAATSTTKAAAAMPAAKRPVATAPAKPAARPAVAATAASATDDFWDDEIPATPASSKPVANPAGLNRPGLVASQAAKRSAADVPKPKKPKPKKENRVAWGADWGKVVAGLAAFVVFGGLAVLLVMATGRISRGIVALAIPGIGGLFSAINGLMGEEGIW